MKIVIAVIILLFVIPLVGRKPKSSESRSGGSLLGRQDDDMSWIDELEILDIIDDDE